MRLERVSVPPHFIARCIGCGTTVQTDRAPLWADLDGEAFKAYYCEREAGANSCDHGHQTDGEVRVLPVGGDSNVIVCQVHHAAELAFRRELIEERGVQWDLPAWGSLKVYGAE